MTREITPIGFGTYQITDRDACVRAVETALETGYRHLDTAQMYDNEAYVGEGLAASSVDRDEVFVATKLNYGNLAAEDVLETGRASIDRLGVDAVDLLYVHWPIETYDVDETLPALAELVDEGLVRNVGLSNFTPDLLEEAIDRLDVPLFAHQVEMHPLQQQERHQELAVEGDYHLVAYSPLARGDVFDVPELVDVAEKHDATPAQVSLAWLLDKENVVPIPKSETPEHIRENFTALELELDDEDVATIDGIDREERLVDFPAAPWNQ